MNRRTLYIVGGTVVAAVLVLWFLKRKGSTPAAQPVAVNKLQVGQGMAPGPQPSGVVQQPDYQVGIPIVVPTGNVSQPGALPSAQTSPYENLGGPVGNGSPLDQAVDPSQIAAGDTSDSVGDLGGGAGTGAGAGGDTSNGDGDDGGDAGNGASPADCKWATDPSGKKRRVCPKMGHWVCAGGQQRGKKTKAAGGKATAKGCTSWRWQANPAAATAAGPTGTNRGFEETRNEADELAAFSEIGHVGQRAHPADGYAGAGMPHGANFFEDPRNGLGDHPADEAQGAAGTRRQHERSPANRLPGARKPKRKDRQNA